MKNILVLSDNSILLDAFTKMISKKGIDDKIHYAFDYAFSKGHKTFEKTQKHHYPIKPLDIKEDQEAIIQKYDLILSLHCRQIFPEKLVNSTRCINIHPGLIQYNRGWYPHIFSMIEGLPCGVTIHEMNARIDHGAIIYQKEVVVNNADTSLSVYQKIIKAEIDLLDTHIVSLIENTYKRQLQHKPGKMYTKKDFEDLCCLDLKDTDTLENHLLLLRALSHGDYRNAYFIDNNGQKNYLRIEMMEK